MDGLALIFVCQTDATRDLDPQHIVLWVSLGVVSSLLAGGMYLLLHSRFTGWMHRARRNTVMAYLAQVISGLVIAFLVDRIGFRELIADQMSSVDEWLVPLFAVSVPPFALLSVLIAMATTDGVDRIHELNRKLEQSERLFRYMLSMRDDVVRLAGCLSAAQAERTKRLRELLGQPGSSCLTIGQAFDRTTHLNRLVEAIHHIFELRGQTAPIAVPVSPITGSDGTRADRHVEIEAPVTVPVSWRVTLFEEQDDCLRRICCWNGHSESCCFTSDADWPVLFSTKRRQAGSFAIACFSNDYPVILGDATKAHDAKASGFKYFARSDEQRRRIQSIAGFCIRTDPVRVMVVDADRPGFFNARADDALFRQLQKILTREFEFDKLLGELLRQTQEGCPIRGAAR